MKRLRNWFKINCCFFCTVCFYCTLNNLFNIEWKQRLWRTSNYCQQSSPTKSLSKWRLAHGKGKWGGIRTPPLHRSDYSPGSRSNVIIMNVVLLLLLVFLIIIILIFITITSTTCARRASIAPPGECHWNNEYHPWLAEKHFLSLSLSLPLTPQNLPPVATLPPTHIPRYFSIFIPWPVFASVWWTGGP